MIKFRKNSPYSIKRILFLLICTIGVALYFWTQSRYPALNKKAMMGGRTNISGIVFDIVLPVYDQDSTMVKIGKSTVNWYNTNWKGMTFGFIFSGLILSILSMFRYRGSKNRFLNTLMGFVFGAPLGVCANCAAPISRSIYESTRSIEASLASLFSSPTFNIVVLTMSFSLLPLEFALTKLFLSLFLIFVGAPMFAKYFKDAPEYICHLKEDDENNSKEANKPTSINESWFKAIFESLKLFLHSLLFIVLATIPAMLLAGFLGAVIIELIPMNDLITMPFSVVGIIAIALLGTFLPVPMSFDVVVVAILLNSGLHPAYAMTLLFTLGIFSIYPFMVIWKTINIKLASTLFASVMILGLIGGIVAPSILTKNNQILISEYKKRDISNPIEEIRLDLKNSCLTLNSPDDFNCVLNVARGVRSKEICTVFSDQKTVDTCFARHYGSRLKFDDCSKYSNPDYINSCLEGFQRVLFSNKIQLERFCLNKNQNAQICKSKNISKVINSGNFKEIVKCEESQKFELEKFCLNYIIKNLDKNSRFSNSQCNHLTLPRNKAYCSFSLALSKNPKLDKDTQEKVCSQWEQPETKQICNNLFLTHFAVESGDTKGCDELFPKMKPNCYTNVYSKSLVKKFYSLIGENRYQSIELLEEEKDQKPNQSTTLTVPAKPKEKFKVNNLNISSFEFLKKSKNSKLMTRYEASELGLSIPDMSFLQGVELPIRRSSNAVSAGDFDNDGFQDLVFSTEKGPYLFHNLGDLKFELVNINTENVFLKNYQLVGVSFIDINNDGFLDIFCFSKKNENFFILNLDGRFGKTRIEPLPDFPNRLYLQTVSFTDIDKDGLLDIFLGFNPPWGLSNPSAMAENVLLKQTKNGWSQYTKYKDRINYLSMSSLFSDINQDGNMDLWIGTDLVLPDQLLMGKKDGGFREILKSDNAVSAVPDNSMSYDSADINNDLIFDVLGIGVGFNPESELLYKGNYCQFIKDKAEFSKCDSLEKKWGNLRDASYSSCYDLADKHDQADCFGYFLYKKAIVLKDPKYCEYFSEGSDLKNNCISVFKYENSAVIPYKKNPEDLKQVTHNVLLIQDKNQKFKEQAREWGVADTGWGWNAKFADFNNDKWNDLYVSNGYLLFRIIGKNFLFINKNGKKFEDQTKQFGIEEVYSSYSHVAVDLLNDGNLSIVSTANNGPTRIYVNNSKSNSIEFELRQNQKLGNTSVIGARIIIKDNSGVSQIREIKGSGGFLSFGPYVQHFGLGQDLGIKEVKIIWADGFVSEIKKEFAANHRYVIER